MTRKASLSCGCAAVGLVAFACACEPTVVIGTRFCGDPASVGATPNLDAGVSLPWSTGFEDGFCDYQLPTGFCYGAGSVSLVTSPVHSGQYAAAFTVQTPANAGGDAGADGGTQVRCVAQGVFPAEAYYGAWYYVPAPAKSTDLWNLFHYQGAAPDQNGNWDVSLVNTSDGGLHLSFFDFLNGQTPDTSVAPPIPIGKYFHIEVYFKRASDTTGQLTLWQDGVQAMNLAGVVTAHTDWGQWYVGNLARALTPSVSTIYVDDVTIRATR